MPPPRPLVHLPTMSIRPFEQRPDLPRESSSAAKQRDEIRRLCPDPHWQHKSTLTGWQLLVLFFIFDKVEVFNQKHTVQVENSVAQHATTRLHDEHLREASQHSPHAT
eukprot:scaffold1555_cov66-Cyclotella_meneghiniana.AAC.2